MGHIRKKGSGYQVVVYWPEGSVGASPYIHKYAPTLTAARRLVAEIEADKHRGDTPAPADLTVGRLVEDWFAFRVPDFAPTTAHTNRTVIRTLITPHLGNLKVAKLTARHLDHLYAELRTRYSPAYIRKMHAVIHAALANAVRWGDIPRNVAAHARPPKLTSRTRTAPEPTIVRSLLAASIDSDPDLYDFIRLSAVAGTRRSESCGLRDDDLDEEACAIRIVRTVTPVDGGIAIREQTKSVNGERLVAIDRETMIRLQKRLANRDSRWVFAQLDDASKPVHPSTVTHKFGDLCDAIGVADVTLHSLRHYCASQALAAGVPASVVASRLGDSVATILRHYAHAISRGDEGVALALAASLEAPAVGPAL